MLNLEIHLHSIVAHTPDRRAISLIGRLYPFGAAPSRPHESGVEISLFVRTRLIAFVVSHSDAPEIACGRLQGYALRRHVGRFRRLDDAGIPHDAAVTCTFSDDNAVGSLQDRPFVRLQFPAETRFGVVNALRILLRHHAQSGHPQRTVRIGTHQEQRHK